jgi:hypothetical protein
MLDGRDRSTFYTLSWYFGHKLHYIKLLQPPKKWTQEKQNINTQTVAFQTHKLCKSSWVVSWWQMKGTHVLFIPFPHILAINYTGHKSTQKGEISSERDFPHDIIGIACTDLDTTFFQKNINWSLLGYKNMLTHTLVIGNFRCLLYTTENTAAAISAYKSNFCIGEP